MTVRCVRCNRPLRHPVMTPAGAAGEKCAHAMFGVKAPRVKRENRKSDDARQVEMYPELLHPVFGVSA
jgi:hypothetical protein